MRPSVLILGYGVVGRNLHKVFQWADIEDPNLGMRRTGNLPFDVAFVCVPTPNKPDGRVDISYVRDATSKANAQVVVIKSTVPPGTTDALVDELGIPIVFSPEFEGETLSSKVPTNFFILGGYKAWSEKVAEAIKYATTGECKIYFTSSRLAELCKYMENSFLAMKVSFCNEFYRVAKKMGISYDELREAWLLDPRIGRSHTYVFEDTPYWSSKCLDKDVPAIIAWAERELSYEMKLMKNVVEVNKGHKNESIQTGEDHGT